MRVPRDSSGRIDWWASMVYLAVLGAMIFAVNDVTGFVPTPAERRIEQRIVTTISTRPAIRGPRGATGPEGPRGESGPRGHIGAQGARGHKGSTGATGARGKRGVRGAQGERGTQGLLGLRGPQGLLGPVGPVGPIPSGDDLTAAICAQLPICARK